METETKTESLSPSEASFSPEPEKSESPAVLAETVVNPEATEEKPADPVVEPAAENSPAPAETVSSIPSESEAELVTISDVEAVDFCKTAYGAIQYELAKVIVGQNRVIEEILISIFTGGNTLILGVPGLAKNLLVSTLAQILGLSFKRIRFTPDMVPADVLGSEAAEGLSEGGDKPSKFLPGPLFANMVLADEINRTPPKTQSAVLEAMQDGKVTVGGKTHDLPQPFFLLATQNPLEQEGTFALPESQLDRFMMMIQVDYPTEEEEFLLMKLGTGVPPEPPRAILGSDHIQAIQQTIRLLPVPDHVYKYAERVVRSTRPKTQDAFDFCKKWLSFGAGPRAGLGLIMAAKAHALIRGQVHVHCGNVAAMAPSILRHRLATNFAAQSEGINADEVIRRILEQIPRTDPRI